MQYISIGGLLIHSESESYDRIKNVLIVEGAQNILDFYLARADLVKNSVEVCYDYNGPMRIKKTVPIWSKNLEVDKRGVKVRFLTDIRNDNLEFCKQILEEIKNIEMRHMDGVKGNFTIHDGKEFFLPLFVDKPGEPVTNALYCTQIEMVDAHLFIFENLWHQALPAQTRIVELERGIPREVLQTIKEPYEIVETGHNLVKSAKDEILIIFHTANALLRQEKSGSINLLVENALKYKVEIRILVPIEGKILNTIHRLERIGGMQIRNIEQTMQTKVTILVVDKTHSLVVELKDDTKATSEEAIGQAVYSNSKSTVLSYVSIFESLWIQSELREELLVRSLAQREFINIAAHELRTPIQPILGLAGILSSRLDAENKEFIEVIMRNARRLERLTEDILDITRIEGKTLKLNRQSFLIAKTIREIIQDYTAQLRKARPNIILSFTSSKDLESIAIVGDENRIKQVITNLIDNSIRFTEQGTITSTAEIDRQHHQIIVSVKDAGKGIAKDILPKLFTKFVTNSEKGTGLGLYICKGIVEAHGGRIWAENNGTGKRDNGATFSFSLPLN
jgi:two-component system sensor histidine kinase VicK